MSEDNRTAAEKADQEKAFNFSSYNKLHWMLGGEGYALKMARDMFVQDLTRAQAAEKAYADHFHIDARMTGQVYNSICDLVAKCDNFYQVEALARFVFDDNVIPTMEQVVRRAGDLRKVMPVFDILKSNKNVRRSF